MEKLNAGWWFEHVMRCKVMVLWKEYYSEIVLYDTRGKPRTIQSY